MVSAVCSTGSSSDPLPSAAPSDRRENAVSIRYLPVGIELGSEASIGRAVLPKAEGAKEIVDVVVSDHVVPLHANFMQDAPEESEQLVGGDDA